MLYTQCVIAITTRQGDRLAITTQVPSAKMATAMHNCKSKKPRPNPFQSAKSHLPSQCKHSNGQVGLAQDLQQKNPTIRKPNSSSAACARHKKTAVSRGFCIDCTCAVSESGIMIHRSASVKTTGKILKRKKITDKTLKNNFKNKFKGRAAT